MHITRFSVFLNCVGQISSPVWNPDFETVPLGSGMDATCTMVMLKLLRHGIIYTNKAMQTNLVLLNFTVITKAYLVEIIFPNNPLS